MTSPVECQYCHQPIRSRSSMARRIGGRCWRKLSPAQRTAIRAALAKNSSPSAAAVRTLLTRHAPDVDGQLPLDEQDTE